MTATEEKPSSSTSHYIIYTHTITNTITDDYNSNSCIHSDIGKVQCLCPRHFRTVATLHNVCTYFNLNAIGIQMQTMHTRQTITSAA